MAIWKVSTYYKKSCEEHEYYYKDEQSIVRKTGYRWSNFVVETDDEIAEIFFVIETDFGTQREFPLLRLDASCRELHVLAAQSRFDVADGERSSR